MKYRQKSTWSEYSRLTQPLQVQEVLSAPKANQDNDEHKVEHSASAKSHLMSAQGPPQLFQSNMEPTLRFFSKC